MFWGWYGKIFWSRVAKSSSRSSSQVKGTKRHEIYVATFSGHLFYDLFYRAMGVMVPWATRGSTTEKNWMPIFRGLGR